MLVAKDLSYSYLDYLVFKEVSFTLPYGSILLVKGDNGSGKSTLLRCLANISNLSSGKIFYQGQNVADNKEFYLEDLYYLGHSKALKKKLTCFENCYYSLYPKQFKLTVNEVDSALKQVGLKEIKNLKVEHLSSGQSQRLAIAKVLLAKAKIWLLDEPDTSLDSSNVTILKELINTHVLNKGITIIASHKDMSFNSLTTNTLHLNNNE